MTRRELAGWGLFSLLGGAVNAGATEALSDDLEARCRREVEELHQFFEDWFNGVLEPTDASFQRFDEVIDADFVIISPGGRLSPRAPLSSGLRGAHGSWKTAGDGKIWIAGFQLHRTAGDFAIVTYEEWQRHGGETRGRLSSAFFGQRDGTPNGLAWLHLHEVWMPSE